MAKKINILVTGGAGYIGSHVCKILFLNNFIPITYDDLSTGNKDFVKWGPLIIGNILDQEKIIKVIKKFKIRSVVHLAAKSKVEESDKKFEYYFHNNVTGTINLLEAMKKCSIHKIIFSSTASVYGGNTKGTIKEINQLSPTNSYGLTKLYCENLIIHFAKTFALDYVILRYFNAAGSDYKSNIGELRDPETHLIPKLSEQMLKNTTIDVYGDQYDTADGTCIRDFIHVNDIAIAHKICVRYILQKNINKIYNLGTGKGYSVFEIVKLYQKILNRSPKIRIAKKRERDPEKLVADPSMFKKEFNWTPVHSNIKNIIESEIYWRKMNI